MKLWDKGISVDDFVESFTVGEDRELDMRLAKYDILGSLAHAEMLTKIGVIQDEEWNQLKPALEQLLDEVATGQFEIEAAFEDVHSKVEFVLTERLGEVGKKIHTARSRNDQVLVDLHLYTKDQISALKGHIKELFDTLLELSEQYKNVLLPGYTHTQIAMPTSFGMWFSAYAECLIDDVILLNAAFDIADQNPLGSAAGYGSSFPIDRQMTTNLLGFRSLKYNSQAAQMSRGRLEKSVQFALSSVAHTLNKLAADVCLYMSQNFGFISFPDALTTGSSIMPHKKNPDVFELVRAKSNRIQSLPMQTTGIISNHSSGYHRDYQELKSLFIHGLEDTQELIRITEFMMAQIVVREDIVDATLYDYMFSVENVNQLVQEGVSFRDAYQKVGGDIQNGDFKPLKNLHHSHEGSIGNLCLNEIRAKMENCY